MPIFLLKYWRYITAAVLLAAIAFAIHHYGATRYKAGKAAQVALYEVAEAKATAEHNRRILEIDNAHAAREQDLQKRLQSALDTPVVRRIRVPVRSVCSPASAGNAEVPEGADPGSGLLEVDDPGYEQFRRWLIQFAGGADERGGATAAVPDRR